MVCSTRAILPFVALGVLSCGGNIIEAASDDLGGSASDTSESDEIGDVETGTSSSGTDESTGDTATTDDPSTSSTSESTTTDPSTDTTTDESTSETTDESTDTVVDTACLEPVSFLLSAVDDSEYTGGWGETMSMLGEGAVLSMGENQNTGVVTFDFDIPCDDTWHIWVRAIDYQGSDTFWTRVDADPQDWTVFDIDCTPGPMMAAYKWNELNRHDDTDPDCQYDVDPWTHEWSLGPHTLELGFRDSYAVSRVWISNTGGSPP
ncbi:hypothetical protein ACNOYE_08345 [Nannocystaceae bacterium ST9]